MLNYDDNVYKEHLKQKRTKSAIRNVIEHIRHPVNDVVFHDIRGDLSFLQAVHHKLDVEIRAKDMFHCEGNKMTLKMVTTINR